MNIKFQLKLIVCSLKKDRLTPKKKLFLLFFKLSILIKKHHSESKETNYNH